MAAIQPAVGGGAVVAAPAVGGLAPAIGAGGGGGCHPGSSGDEDCGFRFRFVLPTGFLQPSTAPCTAWSPVGQRAMMGGNEDPV